MFHFVIEHIVVQYKMEGKDAEHALRDPELIVDVFEVGMVHDEITQHQQQDHAQEYRRFFPASTLIGCR